MTPKHRNRRLVTFALCATMIIGGVYLILGALKQNTQFFHTPSGLLFEGFVVKSDIIRVGGLVVEDSVVRSEDLFVSFVVRDFENPDALPDRLSVLYQGILPDLFREGEGVVLIGAQNSKGEFVAEEILAKHDNNYVPKLPEAGS